MTKDEVNKNIGMSQKGCAEAMERGIARGRAERGDDAAPPISTSKAPLFAALDSLLHRWRTTPALRKGTSADELEAAIETSFITGQDQLDALPRGTKLYSRRTGHFWELCEPTAGGSLYVTGTGGGYSYASDFRRLEMPLTVLSLPRP